MVIIEGLCVCFFTDYFGLEVRIVEIYEMHDDVIEGDESCKGCEGNRG